MVKKNPVRVVTIERPVSDEISTGDIAINSNTGDVVLVSTITVPPIGAGVRTVTSVVLGNINHPDNPNVSPVGTLRNYILPSLSKFNGKVTLSNTKPRTRKKKLTVDVSGSMTPTAIPEPAQVTSAFAAEETDRKLPF